MARRILSFCAILMTLGGCDEALMDADERSLDEQLRDDARAVDDPGAEQVDPAGLDADDLASPSAKDPCSDPYYEHSPAFHACGTCPEGRLVDIVQRRCFGSGAWCPEECGPWEPYPYGPNCTPCD